MLKPLLFALFLSCGVSSAFAQAPTRGESLASQGLKQRLRGQYLTSDTAQAIINLYSRRQAGGAEWVIAALLSAARIGTASAGGTTTNYGGYSTTTDGGSNVGAAFLVASPIMAYGVAKSLRYSNGHLEQVLTAYAAGQPLPHSLRRKLKRRLFTAPIVPYQRINVQPVVATPPVQPVK